MSLDIYETPQKSLAIWAGEIAPAYAAFSPEQRALVLLRMVSEHCDVAMEDCQITLSRPNWEASTQFFQWPVDLQIQALKRDFPGGGLNCAGLATVLAQAILDLEGWPLWLLHVMDGAASHTVLLAEAEPTRIIVLDPMFGHTVTNATGQTRALDSILSVLRGGYVEEIKFHRPAVMDRWLWYPQGMNLANVISGAVTLEPESRIEGVANGRLCRAHDWGIEKMTAATAYGAAARSFLQARGIVPDLRNMFLCPRLVQPLITASSASPEAQAAIAMLGES